MGLGGGRLVAFARDDRRAQLPAHAEHVVAPGQGPGGVGHFLGIGGELPRVGKVLHGGFMAGNAEAVLIERERTLGQPGVADRYRIGLVDAGVELLARRPEAPVDARGGQQVIYRGLYLRAGAAARG